MTSSVRTLATALAGLAVGLAGPALAAPTVVDPGTALRGADPVVTWFDKDAGAIKAEGRTVPVDLPPDTPTDYAGGAAAAAEIGMGRLAKRLEETA